MAHNAPVAVNDTALTPQNHSVVIQVTANDIDTGGGQLTAKIIFQPLNGLASVINTNQVLYTPTQGFFGADSFRYSVCDTFNFCDTATAYVTVLGSNLPPVAMADVYNFGDSIYKTFINVILNDTDPNHDTIFVTTVFNSDNPINLGYLGIDSSTGQVFFIHNAFTCGTQYFKYLLCNYSLCDTGLITITIDCPDSISLPQGISPNGDGKNDVLEFSNLLYFVPAGLKVYNRYGAIVYQNSDYQNNWDGTDGDSHQPLPDGTYFYTLELSNKKTYNNYLVINR